MIKMETDIGERAVFIPCTPLTVLEVAVFSHHFPRAPAVAHVVLFIRSLDVVQCVWISHVVVAEHLRRVYMATHNVRFTYPHDTRRHQRRRVFLVKISIIALKFRVK